MRNYAGMALLLATALLLCGPAAVGDKTKLAPRYREWLEKEVVYIISKEEKDTFLKLTSDEEREKFIDRFWEVRNPSPDAPQNSYKEEHYKRLAYVAQYFGRESATDGWRTDRGRTYISLGPPQQRAYYTGYSELRPMEIWFYSNTNPALPPFFYVVFYQRENIGDYRFYSPYFDGPEKLITSHQAQSGRQQALRAVEQAAGREVARTVLSLIPDEPVDFQGATTSLQSDVLLSTLKNLANHPLTKAQIQWRGQVTARLVHEGEDSLDILTVPLRDTEGNTNLHYVLRLKKPEVTAIGKDKDNRYYYSIEVAAKVLGEDNKPIFTQEKKLSRYFDDSLLEQMQGKVLGYEGWLPLPPGKYRIEFTLTNWVTQAAFRRVKDLVIPEAPVSGLHLTDLVPFEEAENVDASQSNLIPFSAGGLKFTPLTGSQLSVAVQRDLKVFYQIWAPAGDPRAYQDKKLQIDYVYGRPGAQGDSKAVHDEVPKQQFDSAGSLVNGKKIPLTDLPAGNYRMTVTVSDPDSQQKVYSTLGFRVQAFASYPPLDLYDEEIGEQVRNGVTDYQRGLSYLANGQKEQALAWLKKALRKNPDNEDFRAILVDIYFAQQAYGEAAELYSAATLTPRTEELTILRMAWSFDKLNDLKKTIEVLEAALRVKGPSEPLYLTLASLYERNGETQKAAEMRLKGKSLGSSGAAVRPR